MRKMTERYLNNYTGDEYEMVRAQHPRGGLYVYLKNIKTGELKTFHRSNLRNGHAFKKVTIVHQ